MPAEVYEDSIELTLGLLEAVMPTAQDWQVFSQPYPYPLLRLIDRQEKRSFGSLVLENPFLRVTLVPDLGGRMLSLFDKRTGVEILETREALLPVTGGTRGAYLPDGLQLIFEERDRLDSLATAATLGQPADEETDDAAVWVGQVSGKLSYSVRYSIPADRAELRIEVRVFNRVLDNTPYNGGLVVALGACSVHEASAGATVYSLDRDCGLLMTFEDDNRLRPNVSDNRAWLTRLPSGTRFSLGPRQLDSWTVTLTPFSGLRGVPAATDNVAILLREGIVRAQAHRRLPDHKLFLLTEGGQTLEAPADLYPERLLEIPLEGLASPPTVVVLRSPEKEELIRIGVGDAPLLNLESEPDHIAERETGLREVMIDLPLNPLLPTFRPLAHLRSATQAIQTDGAGEAADRHLEQALLYNGEDHLAWWAKAMNRRLAGAVAQEDERPELLNAHYLAPLEPALRAESFLSQGPAMGKEPSPILRPLLESPEQFVEVGCLLLDLGLISEASRWLDESLRHIDLAMLRYLQAFAFLSASRMETEAAQHVQAAGRILFGPPFPWRQVERDALRRLAQAFPDDGRLGEYLALVQAYSR